MEKLDEISKAIDRAVLDLTLSEVYAQGQKQTTAQEGFRQFERHVVGALAGIQGAQRFEEQVLVDVAREVHALLQDAAGTNP